MAINSKKELKRFLERDRIALNKIRKRPKLFGDEIWKLQILLRRLEYITNRKQNFLVKLRKMYFKFLFHKMSIKLGVYIPPNCFDEGLSIAHAMCIVVHHNAKIGKNCRIHEMVNIGATNGSDKAPVIGNNVFIGTGAKIIGDVKIADNVVIGANAVVVHDILEEGTTWGGVPAKKISNNDSKRFINQELNVINGRS